MEDVGFNGVEVVKTLNIPSLASREGAVFGLRLRSGLIPDLTFTNAWIRLGNIATIARRLHERPTQPRVPREPQ